MVRRGAETAVILSSAVICRMKNLPGRQCPQVYSSLHPLSQKQKTTRRTTVIGLARDNLII